MWSSWVSLAFFVLAAAVHLSFFIFEVFLLPRKKYYEKLGYTQEAFKPLRIWVVNLGFYNLCLAIGTLIGLYFIFEKQIMLAGVLTSFCGLSMIMAGFALWFTAKPLRKWAALQFTPPLLGFIFLGLHIYERWHQSNI